MRRAITLGAVAAVTIAVSAAAATGTAQAAPAPAPPPAPPPGGRRRRRPRRRTTGTTARVRPRPLRRPARDHLQAGPAVRAVPAHVPGPAGVRRRLRRRHRQRRPGAVHRGGPGQADRARQPHAGRVGRGRRGDRHGRRGPTRSTASPPTHDRVRAATRRGLAYETVVTGHPGASPSRLHVFTDATTGGSSTPTTRSSTAPATAVQRPGARINTSGSGTSFSMTDPTRPGIPCGNSPRARCSPAPTTCGATAPAPTSRPAASTRCTRPARVGHARRLARPQRHQRHRRRLPDPRRPQRRQRVLGRQPGRHRPQHRRPVDRLARRRRPRVRPRHRPTPPAATSGNGVSRGDRRHLRRADRGLRQRAAPTTRRTSPSARRSTWSARGPIRYMYNPSLVGDPNCYSSSIPNTEAHAAAGPLNHWFYLLAEGTTRRRAAGQPDLQRLDGHRRRHPERRQDLLQRDAVQDRPA